ncbi:hypothetical protein QBC46DRAFT_402699 [Diplogelasinospora grovesii]|uniref:Uncharacterized protein n=1 Tax=Diplogelasinospora grovesii TaxID=303347 RepID=A0AAN6S9T0_9PEZI|nr:hypothetical protein QBC46DRAFT_402699 [Diplogelasinospora grovesii]
MDFAAAYTKMMGEEDPLEAMRELFPTRHRRQAFKDWIDEQARKAAPETLTRDKFVADIDNAQFFDPSFLDSMVPSMGAQLRPWVPVGRDENFSYRLTVEPNGLQASANADPASQFPTCILAFQSPGKPDFIFFQLGELEYTPYTNTTAIRRWEETGFYVVARVGLGGKMDGIFAIYSRSITIWAKLPLTWFLSLVIEMAPGLHHDEPSTELPSTEGGSSSTSSEAGADIGGKDDDDRTPLPACPGTSDRMDSPDGSDSPREAVDLQTAGPAIILRLADEV